MAELDYIERRKLWDEVIKSKTNNSHLNEIQRQSHIHEHRVFQRMIIEQPAADVVEVVRCKSCKSWEECGIDPITGYYFGYCQHSQWQDKNDSRETNGQDFCSYGKRKE